MKIAVDVMGYENDIKEAVQACEKLVKKYLELEIILVGKAEEINQRIKNYERIEVVNANSFVTQEDSVMTAMRKKDSSMAVAIDLVVNGKADAVVSAGSTPCYVSMTYHKMGMIKNVSKPAFMPSLPTCNKNPLLWMDVGANKTCEAQDLVNFAIMGSIAFENIFGEKNPKVSLLNIGTEDHKGLDSIVEANQLLKNDKRIKNYIGFTESRDILWGNTNVLISDGFTGNIALKALEGSFKVVGAELKKGFKKPSGWLGGLFALPVVKSLKKTFDYKNNAGAIVMGLNYLAIKTHGSADEQQFYSTIELAIKCINNDLVKKIKAIKFN